ncbi:unnamed protein product [Rhizophagus irregularis]|nr:unnamed protein product [Rhizophagus irregularis]
MENLRKRNEKIEIKKRNITWINPVLKTAKVDTTSIPEYDKERINKIKEEKKTKPLWRSKKVKNGSLEENDEETQDKISERFLDKKGSSSI